MKGIKNRR